MRRRNSTLEDSPESKSDSPERFSGVGSHPPTSRGLNRLHGPKNGPSGELARCLRLSVTHRRRRPDKCSSFSRRSSSRVTVVRRHLPARAVGTPRAFNSRAMALMETKPAFRSLRIVGPKASARTSATRLVASSLLIPPFPDVSRLRRVSVLTTVVRCHIPPPAAGIPLRFNSFASPRWETKPAAISSRMLGSKARARASAARLPDNPPCIPRLLGEVSPRTRSIGPSWPVLDARLGVKNVSRSGSARAAPGRAKLIRRPQTNEGPPRKSASPDGPLTCRYIRGQVVR